MKKAIGRTIWLLWLLLSFQQLQAQQEIPATIRDLMQRGISALDTGDGPEALRAALAAFQEATIREPRYAEVHYYLGKTYSLFPGGLARSQRELELYLQLYPEAADRQEVLLEISRINELRKKKWKSDRLGCEFVKTKRGIYVGRINPSSDAARIGMREGYQVKMVGNDTVNRSYTLEAFYSLMDEYPGNGFVIRLQKKLQQYMVAWKKKDRVRMGYLYELEEEDLDSLVRNSRIPVLVAFWHPWCDGCRDYGLVLQDLAQTANNRILVISARIDEYSIRTELYKLTGVPISRFYLQGELSWELPGADGKELKAKVEHSLQQ